MNTQAQYKNGRIGEKSFFTMDTKGKIIPGYQRPVTQLHNKAGFKATERPTTPPMATGGRTQEMSCGFEITVDWLKQQYSQAMRDDQTQVANVYQRMLEDRGVTINFQSAGLPTTGRTLAEDNSQLTYGGYEITTNWLKQEYASAVNRNQTATANVYRKMLTDRGVAV